MDGWILFTAVCLLDNLIFQRVPSFTFPSIKGPEVGLRFSQLDLVNRPFVLHINRMDRWTKVALLGSGQEKFKGSKSTWRSV
jgi:hypothetical protein